MRLGGGEETDVGLGELFDVRDEGAVGELVVGVRVRRAERGEVLYERVVLGLFSVLQGVT